jgi:endonuclease/exonuclease/phosphatase family metal-dependent hydrolase
VKPFRVLQFNMQFGQVWDDQDPNNAPVRLEDAIAEIARQDADLIHLQEVEQARPGGVQPQPPPNYGRLRAALPGHPYGHFGYPPADPRELPFGIGLAILSRTPLRDAFVETLPSPPLEFDFFGETKTPTDRVLIGATTEIAGRPLRLLTTHLLALFMLKSDSRAHPEQRRRVAARLRATQAESMPTILSGDFNVRDHVGLAAEFAAEGFSTVQTSEITWRRQPYVLDHIFHNAPLRCVDRRVVPTMSSDHHMLIADFVWA